jgi:hypothetical protein
MTLQNQNLFVLFDNRDHQYSYERRYFSFKAALTLYHILQYFLKMFKIIVRKPKEIVNYA